MAAYISLEAVTPSDFQILNQKSCRFLLATILYAFINYGFLEDFINFPSSDSTFAIILISSKFLMNFCKNNQNAAILETIKISKNCHGRFTANYPKFLSSTLIQRKK